jgi:hypothetical protein
MWSHMEIDLPFSLAVLASWRDGSLGQSSQRKRERTGLSPCDKVSTLAAQE